MIILVIFIFILNIVLAYCYYSSFKVLNEDIKDISLELYNLKSSFFKKTGDDFPPI